MSAPDLVVAGNLLVDDIVLHDGRTLMGEPGGGALYVSLAASLWKVRVGLVSLLGNDYPTRAIDALRARGVDLAGVRRLEGPALRSWLLYEPRGRQIVHQIGTAGHGAVSPGFGDFPESYFGAPMTHVCPMPFEYQRALVADLARRQAHLSLDPHETVRPDNLEAWSAVFDALELFFVSHEELRLGPPGGSPEDALHGMGAHHPQRYVLLKCGVAGGVKFNVNENAMERWRSRADEVVDATGAGDAFAGGFLAGWLRGEPERRWIERGVVSASYAIASWGPRALIAATPEDAERRLAEWYGA